MDFSIKEYNGYNEKEVLYLYQSVGWTNYVNNPAMLKNAYAHSLKILGAYENEKLLGVIRVVGDGYSVVFIQDIIVLPEYQRHGIGTALLGKILEIYENVYQKVLLTENTEKTIQFYKSAGFEMDTDIACRAFLKMY
ncbi:MAG: GNAT family N-acetyltransferase [Ruminococcus sp.]|nr:GNAT family N-acetyltransferase [Ruminococcus sp.]MCM1156501.1 GNAT family N-acetyltransferase [Roseburia sp.]